MPSPGAAAALEAFAGQTAKGIVAQTFAPQANVLGQQIASLFQSPALAASMAALAEKTIKATAAPAINNDQTLGIGTLRKPFAVPPLNLTFVAPARPTAKLMIDLFAEQNVKIDELRADVSDMNTKMTAMATDIAVLRQATVTRWVLVTLLSLGAAAGLAAVALMLLIRLHAF